MRNVTEKTEVDRDKRKFLKKAAYTAPAIITLTAIPSYASSGSGWTREHRHPGRNRNS